MDLPCDQGDDVMAFDETVSSSIVFDGEYMHKDRENEMLKDRENETASVDSVSILDIQALHSAMHAIQSTIALKTNEEKANEAVINALIKDDAIEQFRVEDSVAEKQSFQDSQYTESARELFQLCLDTKPVRPGFVDPSKWDSVRNCMLTNPHLMPIASRVTDDNGLTALHHACRHQPPVNVIELFVSCAGLETLSVADQYKRLPIHYACKNNASVEVIKALTQLNPACRIKQDQQGGTPLHYAIANKNAPIDMVVSVCSEEAACSSDQWGMIPLHHAVLKDFPKPQAIKMIIIAYPLGLSEIDMKGRAPIHSLMRSCHVDAVAELLEFSLAIDPALAKGDMGLHLLILLREWADNHAKSSNAQKCLDLLLKNNPEPSEAYLKKLKGLPRWLNKGGAVKRRQFFQQATKK